MKALLDSYKKARETFINAVDKFPKQKREEALFDKWNLKQLISHIGGWDNCIADNVKYLKEDKEPVFYGAVDSFNARSIEEGKNWNWEKAYAEFIAGGERVIKEYETLDPALWDAKFWKTKSSTPEKLLKIVTQHYNHEHLPQLLKYLE
jgi:hypothetical protein